MAGLGRRRRRWSTSAPASADLALQGAVCGAARRGSPRPSSCWPRLGRRALAWPVYLAAVWAARLGHHHRRSASGRRAVHRLRLLRRHRRHRPHRRPARPSSHRTAPGERVMTRHVVFGTGQVGRLLVEQLVARGHDVVAVNRSGGGRLRRAPASSAATPPTRPSPPRVCRRRRRRLLLPQRDELRAAGRRSSRPCSAACSPAPQPPAPASSCSTTSTPTARPRGRDLVETHAAANPTSAKAATRAAMTAELLDAHRAGQVEVAIGRASDYFGPEPPARPSARRSSARPSAGRAAQVMGDPDQPHSYSYTPDVAAGLITLGTAPGGRRQHLAPAGRRDPHHPADHRAGLRRSPAIGPRILAAGRTTLRAARRWSSRRCASTCTPSTSSPTAGSSTTASSAPRSATRPPRSTTPSPPPSRGTADRDRPPPGRLSTRPPARHGRSPP